MAAVKEILSLPGFQLIAGEGSENLERDAGLVYTCDLLSFVMGKAPHGCVWVTVMGNVNAAAVSVLCDMACIVLAEGVQPDPALLQKAGQQDIAILGTSLPVFDAALAIHRLLVGAP